MIPDIYNHCWHCWIQYAGGRAGEQSVTTTFSHLAYIVHGRRRGTQIGAEPVSQLADGQIVLLPQERDTDRGGAS